jgi:hypothetical protein
MNGRTVSAYTDEATADRIARIARLEDRRVGQVAGAALRLYAMLPAEARDALRQMEALPGDDALREAVREMTLVLARRSFAQARKAIAVRGLSRLDNENRIPAAAVKLTRPTKRPAR